MMVRVKSCSRPYAAGRVWFFWVFGRPLGGLDMGRKIASFDTPEEILLRFIPVTEAGRPFRNAASSCSGMMECPWVTILFPWRGVKKETLFRLRETARCHF